MCLAKVLLPYSTPQCYSTVLGRERRYDATMGRNYFEMIHLVLQLSPQKTSQPEGCLLLARGWGLRHRACGIGYRHYVLALCNERG